MSLFSSPENSIHLIMLSISKNILVPLLLHPFVQLELLSCKPLSGRLSPVLQYKQVTSCVGDQSVFTLLSLRGGGLIIGTQRNGGR